jgi:tetratricopeptide (TPR) repeat protein
MASSAESSAPSLTELDAAYQQAMTSGLYSEAADAQKRYIGALLADPRFDRVEWGRSLDRLAEAQLLSDDYESAIQNFELSVEVLEEATNRLDVSLAEPLAGLARAYSSAGNLGQALDVYERAIHTQRVNYGPFAFDQAVLLDEMSEVAYRAGDHKAANNYKLAYASVYRQTFEDDYLKQVDALLSQTEMLVRTEKLLDAQLSYRRIIADIEVADGGRSLALLPAIYDFAELLENHTIADGINGPKKARRFLRRAVHIVSKNKDATPLQRAEAYVAYADYLTVNSADYVRAMGFYRDAWVELSSDPAYAEVREHVFGRPVLLNPMPYNVSPVMRKVLEEGSRRENVVYLTRLSARFDVDAGGSARNIAIVDGDPSGYMDPILRRHVEMLRYRPMFVDAEPIETIDQSFVVEYPATDFSPNLGQNGLGLKAAD